MGENSAAVMERQAVDKAKPSDNKKSSVLRTQTKQKGPTTSYGPNYKPKKVEPYIGEVVIGDNSDLTVQTELDGNQQTAGLRSPRISGETPKGNSSVLRAIPETKQKGPTTSYGPNYQPKPVEAYLGEVIEKPDDTIDNR